MTNKAKNFSIVLSLIGILSAVYFLIFTGTPISDDEDLFLSATRNLVEVGELSAEQLSGNLRLQGNYHGVEPAHPVLASLWYRVFSNTNFVRWQILFFLTIIYTIFACVFIYLIAKSTGYDGTIGIIAALAYGLSTMTLPYVKTFFREPLLIFLLLGGWLAFLNFDHKRKKIRYVARVGFPIFILLLVFTKIIFLVVPVTFFLIWLFDLKKQKKEILYNKVIQITVLFSILGFIFLFSTRNFTDANAFYRFSGALLKDAIRLIFFTPHTYFFEAILASLFSPLKGLVFYSPLVLLGIYSLITKWKKQTQLFTLPIVVLFTLLFAQALAHDGQWWTPTWGSRFLLPVISLFVIASLPVLDDLFQNGIKGHFLLAFIFLGGFIIQLPALLFNSSKFFARTFNYSYPEFSEELWSFEKLPHIHQWDLASLPHYTYNSTIWRTYSSSPSLVIVFILLSFSLFTISIWWLYLDIKNKSIKIITKLFVLIPFTFLLSLNVLAMGFYDPAYRIREYQPLCNYLQENMETDDLLIVDAYPSQLWDFFSAYECGQGIWYSLPYEYSEDMTSLSYERAHNSLLNTLNYDGARVWFISQSEDYSMPALGEEAMIVNNYHLMGEKRYLFPANIYLALYDSQLRKTK
jgi:hypothetical protein